MTLPATGFVPNGPTTEATVERVVDGDTIVVDSGGVELYVRYIGMDAPEAVKLDTPVQFMAPEATQANAQLVSGQTVILERDTSEADDSARLLRHVWVDRDGTLFLVGLELVKAGFAQATPLPPDTKYEALYADAEAQAKAAGLGIWGAPPDPGPESSGEPATADPVAPHVHEPGPRRDTAASSTSSAAGSASTTGRRSRSRRRRSRWPGTSARRRGPAVASTGRSRPEAASRSPARRSSTAGRASGAAAA